MHRTNNCATKPPANKNAVQSQTGIHTIKQEPIDSIDDVSQATCSHIFLMCEKCPKTFTNRRDRLDHTLEHYVNKKCSACSKTLIRINSDWYEVHRIQTCAKNVSDMNAASINSESIVDDEPEAIFIESEPSEMDFSDLDSSDVCHRSSSDGPDSHTEKPPERRKRKYFCTFFDHRPTGELICDICNKITQTHEKMARHMSRKHGKELKTRLMRKKLKRVSCNKCGKICPSQNRLDSHRCIHMEYRYLCIYCGREFKKKIQLQLHETTHTDERPFSCSICDKSFKTKARLCVHNRVHTGEKPYVCKFESCNRAYSHSIDLKRHIFSVHGIYTKKHPCPICSKVFSENKLLKRHLAKHPCWTDSIDLTYQRKCLHLYCCWNVLNA